VRSGCDSGRNSGDLGRFSASFLRFFASSAASADDSETFRAYFLSRLRESFKSLNGRRARKGGRRSGLGDLQKIGPPYPSIS
jgi:hypothetical protein